MYLNVHSLVTPKDTLVLISGISECYLIWKKSVFVDAIKLRDLRRVDYPGLPRKALNAIINILIRRGQREI